ncbi:MAG: ATP-binding protein [Kiloniellales bacterium]|nr:ATP-binding protein [Kiloniellales bacterium]
MKLFCAGWIAAIGLVAMLSAVLASRSAFAQDGPTPSESRARDDAQLGISAGFNRMAAEGVGHRPVIPEQGTTSSRRADRLPSAFDPAHSVPQGMPKPMRIPDSALASVSREEEKRTLVRPVSLSAQEDEGLASVLRWAGGIGAAAVVILVILAWNRRLRRQVAKRRRAEEALRESEARAKAMLNTGSQLQGLLKPDGTLIEINAAALAMIGASEEDVLGLPFWDCPWWTHDPDLQAQLKQALKRAADGESVRFLATHHATDGTAHIINFGATPVRDEHGEVTLIVPMGDDITHLKQAEAELRQAKEQAETALAKLTRTQQQLVVSEKMASLGQLTAGVAHEIKNPLNFINNFAEVSVELIDELRQAVEPARQALSGEQRNHLDDLVSTLTANMATIDEQGRRADSIVKNMLQHARDEGSERRDIDVNTFLEENLKLAYHGARAQDQSGNVALERNFDPKAGSITIAVQDISRVLLNLFGNGIYAMRQRQRLETSGDYAPVLRVSSRDCGDRVEIRVRDNGTGIPGDVANNIFDPFFTTKPPGEGTGLGLSLSYDTVVHQHGGSLGVESEEDRFTEFVLVLPRHPAPHSESLT